MLLLMFFTGTWTSAGPFCGFSISLGQCNKRENLKRESLKGTLDSMGLTRSLTGLLCPLNLLVLFSSPAGCYRAISHFRQMS